MAEIARFQHIPNLGFLGCIILVFGRFLEKVFRNLDFRKDFKSVSKKFELFTALTKAPPPHSFYLKANPHLLEGLGICY